MSKFTLSFACELAREHAVLLGRLADLEKGAQLDAVPAAALLDHLREVQGILRRHFDFEEQGGYMSHVLAAAPYLHRAAQELLDEHRRLSACLDALVRSAQGVPPLSVVAPSLQAQVVEWLRLVREHEGRENGFVQQASNRDIGADD
jgi:hypothetical protein